MDRIAAVLVTYNRKVKLQNCIKAVIGQECSIEPDVIVVDNNSCDGTADLFTGIGSIFDDKRILYYNTGMNIGGAGGFAYGIRKACELGYDYIWLMDDDCVPASDSLEKFIAFNAVHRGEYGFLSSKAIWHDGELCRMNIQRETLTRNVRNWERSTIRIEMASFVSLFLPFVTVQKVGLPFKKFYLWSDDWEYTRRISRMYECFLLPDSVVIHDMESNKPADISTTSEDRLFRYRYLYRNDVYLYRREGFRGCCYEMVRIPWHICRILFSKGNLKEKSKKINVVIEGTLDGIRFFPEPERINVD